MSVLVIMLLTPTESATKQLQFVISFNTVRNAKVKLWSLKSKVDRLGSRVGHFETEMELKGFTLLLIKVGFLSFEMCFEVISRSKWAVISKENDRIDFLQCEKTKIKNGISIHKK